MKKGEVTMRRWKPIFTACLPGLFPKIEQPACLLRFPRQGGQSRSNFEREKKEKGKKRKREKGKKGKKRKREREKEKKRKREKEDTRTRWSFKFHLADLSRIAF